MPFLNVSARELGRHFELFALSRVTSQTTPKQDLDVRIAKQTRPVAGMSVCAFQAGKSVPEHKSWGTVLHFAKKEPAFCSIDRRRLLTRVAFKLLAAVHPRRLLHVDDGVSFVNDFLSEQ